MPIPVTPRFKRLLETANPEQKKALGTSSVQSDSDTRDYHREKRASMPQAMRDIEYNYQDTENMTPGEKYKYEFETFLRRSRDRFGNDSETLKFLDIMENNFYLEIFKQPKDEIL